MELAHPRPTRPTQPLPAMFQTSPPRPPQQQESEWRSVIEDEEGEAVSIHGPKRRKTESDARDETADEAFRKRYDSIWDWRGYDDRKGSGSGGAVN